MPKERVSGKRYKQNLNVIKYICIEQNRK